jgi:hypothetical protein
MTPLKKYILIFLVALAILATGLGGLQDMLDGDWILSKEHLWHDGMFLMALATFTFFVMK